MPYFKARPALPLNKPTAHKVLVVQLIVTVIAGGLASMIGFFIGLSVVVAGGICVLGQAFYNFRALRNFGDRDITKIIASTYSALWGKWLIIISGSLIAVMQFEQLSAGALYASLFGIHTLGVLLIPVLVKRVAQ